MLGNFWLAENLVPSKEGFCPVELVKIMHALCNRSVVIHVNVAANITIDVWCKFDMCISTFCYVFTYYSHMC